MSNNKKIMISYGRKDAEIFAQELKDFLVGQGHKVWIDKSKEEDSGIRGGSVWETEIEEAIKDNNIVIAILSPHAIRRPDGVCLDEISMARFEKKFIIPLMYKEVKPPLCIFRLDWIDFLRSETQASVRDGGLEKLSRSIENNKLDYEGKNKAFSALKSINFDSRLTGLRKEFIGRRWIYDAENPNSESLIEDWLKSEKNILLILGDPGVGKSAITAHLIEKHPACIAYHFCISGDEDTLNPNKFIKSIAHQLATQLDDNYSDQVLEEMAELPESSWSLFRTLISNPLSQLANNSEKKYFIVIDGLDEASKNGSDNKLLKLFSTKFIDELPDHIRFVFTSRRNRDIESRFAIHNPFEIETTEQNNMSDMKEYILMMLDKQKISMSSNDVDILIEKSEGSILYLREIARQAKNSEDKTIDVESLPKGLDGIYLEFFDKSFDDYEPYRVILSVLVATYSPIKLTLLEIITGQENLSNKYSVIQEYFPLNEKDEITVFHKSLLDWLKKKRTNSYYVAEEDGHKMIVDSEKLDLSDEYELRIYLFSATKFFLYKQEHRHKNISDFYYTKIEKELDNLKNNSKNISLVNSLKQLIKNDSNSEKNEYNDIMLKKLNSLFVTVSDTQDKSEPEDLVYLEKLYKQDNEKWAEDYIDALATISHNKEFALTKALDISKKLYEQDSNNWMETYIKVMTWLGYEYARLGKTNKVKNLQEKILDISSKQNTKDPDVWAERYIGTLNSLAKSYEAVHGLDKAKDLLHKSLRINAVLYKKNPERWAKSYISVLSDLAVIHRNANETLIAVEYEKETYSILESLYQNSPDKWVGDYIRTLKNLAILYKKTNNIDDAIFLENKCINILQKYYQENPLNWAKVYVEILHNLAISYKKMNKTDDAIKLEMECINITENLYNENPTYWAELYAELLIDLGISYKESNIDKAIEMHSKSLLILNSYYEKNPSSWAEIYTRALMNMALTYKYKDGHNLDKATRLLEKALEIQESLYKMNQSRWAKQYTVIQISLATMYKEVGRIAEAIELEEKCLDIRTELYDKNKERWAEHYTLALINLGTSYGKVGKFDEAVKLQKKSLSIRKLLYDRNNDRWLIFYLSALKNLANTYDLKGDFADALKYFEEWYMVLQSTYGDNDAKTKDSLEIVNSIKKKMKVEV